MPTRVRPELGWPFAAPHPQSSEYRERLVRASDEGAANNENDPLPDPPERRIAPLPTANQVEFLHRIANVQPTIR
jgi:hypothetical protein